MTPSRSNPLASLAARVSLVCCAAAGPASAAEVEVQYVQPERFADAGQDVRERERTLKVLGEYLRDLGARLPAGQTLRLEITDLDLAGEVEPFAWRRFEEVRVLRGRADWPHLNLRYTLLADGRTVDAGEARLSDMSYLHRMRGADRAGGELAVEKRMVRRWFEDTFAAAR